MTIKTKYIPMYMEIAKTVAQYSCAIKRKVGCIIIKNDRIISVGLNGTPPGWVSNNCEYVDDNGILCTLPEVIHAEDNCFRKLKDIDESCNGAVLFVTTAPCFNCANIIIKHNIQAVFYKDVYRTVDGIEFLQKNNIEVFQV